MNKNLPLSKNGIRDYCAQSGVFAVHSGINGTWRLAYGKKEVEKSFSGVTTAKMLDRLIKRVKEASL